MNKILKRLVLGLVSTCVFSTSALAATITPSQTDIMLQKNDTAVSFDIILKADEAFAGAEFGIMPSQTDVTFSKITFSDRFQKESTVQTLKDGCLYFGFFASDNKYEAGEYTVATINYHYSGSSTRTISLKESKIVTVDTETKTTSGDTSTPSFTVTIKRTSNSSGGGGASSGRNPGGTTIPDVKIPTVDKPYGDIAFTDIDSHWAREYILEAVNKKLFTGTSQNTFSPDDSVTRAMAITVLGRFAGVEEDYEGTLFNDVAAGSYYEDYVAWGAQKGIVKGMSATEFAPDISITREQLSAMIIRYLNSENILIQESNGEIENHEDYNEISEYAVESMTKCYNIGLITGHDNGLLAPKETLTRAQFAVIILRLSNYITNIR